MELTADNPKLDQARGVSLKLPITTHHLNETRGQRDANKIQEVKSSLANTDGKNMSKAENTTCSAKISVDQSANTSMRDKRKYGQSTRYSRKDEMKTECYGNAAELQTVVTKSIMKCHIILIQKPACNYSHL